MNKNLKTFLYVIAGILIAGASLAYGALTAPKHPQSATTPIITSTTPTITPNPHKKPTKQQLEKALESELPTITSVMTAQYPKIATDYTASKGQLFDEGQWYGTALTYHGADSSNRDTLRVLMQKKDGVWVLRTTPPTLLLSAAAFPDVPKSILKTINQPVSLPAGNNSPALSPNE